MSRPRILITGGSGLLGHSLARHYGKNAEVLALRHSHPVDAPGVREEVLDLTDTKGVQACFDRFAPELVIHTAGLTNVDQCESDPDLARVLNVEVTRTLAKSCDSIGAKLVHVSTDHLFDGKSPLSTEEKEISPLNEYARTKAEAETQALNARQSLVLRTNFFGHGRVWRQSFSDWILEHFRAGKPVNLFTDSFFTPISTTHFALLTDELLAKCASGVFNMAGRDRISKHDFGVKLARHFGFDDSLIRPTRIADLHLKAPRPNDMSLSTGKLARVLGHPAPSIDEGIATLGTDAK